MRKFKVKEDNDLYKGEFFIIVHYDGRDEPISIGLMRRFYKLSIYDIYIFTNGYKGYIFHLGTNALLFHSEEEAERFINDVLIPREIAYNL